MKGELTKKKLSEFRSEMEICLKMKPHPNVVQVYGIYVESVDSFGIVVEYCARGSLERHLKSDAAIMPAEMLAFIEGIAGGMLHIKKQKIIHRDLAARNVLLSADMTPKV
jgi:c-src tyrosine kinase